MACFALGFCSCLILVKRKSYVNNRWPLQLKLQGRALTRACALDNRNPPLCVQFNHLIMLSKNFAKKCKNFSGILIIKDLYLKIRKHWNSKQSIFWWGNLWSNRVYRFIVWQIYKKYRDLSWLDLVMITVVQRFVYLNIVFFLICRYVDDILSVTILYHHGQMSKLLYGILCHATFFIQIIIN